VVQFIGGPVARGTMTLGSKEGHKKLKRMQRHALLPLTAALVLASAGALAQGGDLAGVTMRVLDDVSDVDAVVLELDAGRGEGEDGASADDDAGAAAEERSRAAARRDGPAEDVPRPDSRERDELHDVDADERGEGRIEDRDVERQAVPPASPP
jgi:hypothetical protein